MDEILQVFRKEILIYYPNLTKIEWDNLAQQLVVATYKKGATIFPTTEVCKQILFISKGIVASEYQAVEDFVISRFFKSKGLCTNIISLTGDQLSDDRLFAITAVQGVLIPKEVFLKFYLYSDKLGLYFRNKLIEIIVEDKRFISIKTNSSVQTQLTFLQNHYPEVVLESPWKYIASFMGVTPAWLSRVLKKGKE